MISQRDSWYSLDDGKCFHREIEGTHWTTANVVTERLRVLIG